jgi:hypothetical protein
MYSPSDIRLQEILLRQNTPSEAELKNVYTALWDIACVAVGNSASGTLTVTDQHILARSLKPQTSIERILEVLEQGKLLRLYRGGGAEHRGRVQFTAPKSRLEETVYRSKASSIKATAGSLMRLAGSEAFAKEVFIDQAALVKNSGISVTEFRDAARTLESLGLLRYTPPMKLPRQTNVWNVALLGQRQSVQHVDVGANRMQLLLEESLMKLEQMSRYASDWSCRRNTILNYFGERPATLYCGQCDWCVSRVNAKYVS